MSDEINQAFIFHGANPGPRLIVTGAVHGNETCGTEAIQKIMRSLNENKILVKRGQLTFVPIANPLAYSRKQRFGERNLNRMLMPYAEPQTFEDHMANWLCPLLASHDVLLDLHSFQSAGQAFVMVGPENNNGAIEPFKFAREEQALAKILGVDRALDGWLDTYDRGIRRRLSGDNSIVASEQNLRYGMGTTEYMRSQGGYGVTLECGQHLDPQAPLVAYQAIINTLTHLDLIDTPGPLPARAMESLRLYEVVDKEHADDAFAQTWSSFDSIKKGQLIGTRKGGEQLLAPDDGYIVFPDAKAQAGCEWFYLARFNDRFA